jgi:hypothetical protein
MQPHLGPPGWRSPESTNGNPYERTEQAAGAGPVGSVEPSGAYGNWAAISAEAASERAHAA